MLHQKVGWREIVLRKRKFLILKVNAITMCAPISASTASVVSTSSTAIALLANKLIAFIAIAGAIGLNLFNAIKRIRGIDSKM